jgi:hypothetical protein
VEFGRQSLLPANPIRFNPLVVEAVRRTAPTGSHTAVWEWFQERGKDLEKAKWTGTKWVWEN